MSFLVSAALAIALLVAAPFLAHLLRRGRAKEQAFPPTRWVPASRSVARQRARLEDRGLFLLRAAMIVLLAALGAVPLVQCSRLSLERQTGASVAVAMVLDDSLSMGARLADDKIRWDRARRAALDLVGSARRGDAFAIVLAGRPARVALSATTDLDAVRRVLGELAATDRSTDLEGAVQMARGLLAGLPQRDRQLAVLSDFAGEGLPSGEPPVWAPLPELSARAETCGVVGAERRPTSLLATIACSSLEAAQGRKLEAFAADLLSTDANDPPLASVPLLARAGVQTQSLEVPPDREVLSVRLTGKDALSRDDTASVGRVSLELTVAVNAEAQSAGTTGGPSLVEQGLAALGGEVRVRPLAVLPEDAAQLNTFAAIILDDPGGLGPEIRSALEAWVARGGVAVALLGPRAQRRALGSTLSPFAEGGLPWESTSAKGPLSETLGWLGPEASGLSDLTPKGRVRLDGSGIGEVRITGRWDDGAVFLHERDLGRGRIFAVGLPSSAELSDLALRPGFLAFLDHVLVLARERSGHRRSLPGVAFRFPVANRAEVRGPLGRIVPHTTEGPPERRSTVFIPEQQGRYRIRSVDGEEERVVAVDATEIMASPRPPTGTPGGGPRGERRRDVNASPEISLALLALVAGEALLRLARGRRLAT